MNQPFFSRFNRMCRSAGKRFCLTTLFLISGVFSSISRAEPTPLEAGLLAEPIERLAQEARRLGSAERGALLFYQPKLGCAACHLRDANLRSLGPDLARLGERPTRPVDQHVVESILQPSKVIRKGYETTTVVTQDGRIFSGIVEEEAKNQLVLRDSRRLGERITLATADIDQRTVSMQSTMPTGLVGQLADRGQFFDLVKYVVTVIEGGPREQLSLRPMPSEYLPAPLPAYENDLDHAGLLKDWDDASLKRGQVVYERVCQTCHGTATKEGTMPTALRFASGQFRNGFQPHQMYQTVTRGFQLMPAQTNLTPAQKYDAIYYIRKTFLEKSNPSQFYRVDADYFAGLPKGTSRGPQTPLGEPWRQMDYGNALGHTVEAGPRTGNFAYKGLTVRVDTGAGGVAKGNAWVLYDKDTLRVAAGWVGDSFSDWQGIQFDGAHGVHPHVQGPLTFSTPVGPGWGNPEKSTTNADLFLDPRTPARDGRRYGPLPRSWVRFLGLYQHGAGVAVEYAVDGTKILETPGYRPIPGKPNAGIFVRSLWLAPHKRPLALRAGDGKVACSLRPRGVAEIVRNERETVVVLAPSAAPTSCDLFIGQEADGPFVASAPSDHPITNVKSLAAGGPPRWRQSLSTTWIEGSNDGPFAVDTLTAPTQNPWNCQMRFTGFDFLDADRLAICTWDGDVWLVSGLAGKTGPKTPKTLTWRRFATGLFQPLGLKIIRGQIFVTCRDQIAILRDLNDDGEADYIECFNGDQQVTEHFHEFAMGLQTDDAGNLYYAKSARHALPAVVPQHGTLLRVSPDGARTDILATGFRAANGVCVNPDGTFFVTDQEGHWNPKNRINWVRQGDFYGNMFGYHDVTDSSDRAMQQPLCWITNRFDRSPAELLWVQSPKWGSLNGRLLNLSYGYGKVYIVPHERVGDQMQGGMCELPIPPFPTGIVRGRFSPTDGQLYVCGLYAWAGSQQLPGGFYRIRATGKPVHVPVELKAQGKTLTLKFSDKLDPKTATQLDRYCLSAWSLRRTQNYGSPHLNERSWSITKVSLSADQQTVTLEVPDLRPTWCMEIKYELISSTGAAVNGVVHNTIHDLNGR